MAGEAVVHHIRLLFKMNDMDLLSEGFSFPLWLMAYKTHGCAGCLIILVGCWKEGG
jgi:hypothetical protein